MKKEGESRQGTEETFRSQRLVDSFFCPCAGLCHGWWPGPSVETLGYVHPYSSLPKELRNFRNLSGLSPHNTRACRADQLRNLQMKLRLITLTAACAAMLATISIAHAQEPAEKDAGGNRHRHHKWGNSLEHMTKTLDLTPDQQAKIGPILEQAKPQLKAARQESKEKMRALRDNLRSQIRPLLTPVQQQKWDAIQKARDDMRKAREALRAAEQQ